MRDKRLLAVLGSICLALILAALPFVGACVPEEEAPQPPPPTPTKILKVGAYLPLGVAYGAETKKCAEIIVDELNEAGGLQVKGERYNVELVIYDDKYSAEGGKAAAERLVHQDKVKYIIGPLGSAPTSAAIGVTEPNKVILLVSTMAPIACLPEHYYSARANNTAETAQTALFKWVIENNPDAKIATGLAGENPVGHTIMNGVERVVTESGLKWVEPTYFSPEEMHFGPIASKIVRSNPDLLFSGGIVAASQWGLIAKALYEAGYKNLITMPEGLDLGETVAVCGEEALENWCCRLGDTSVLPDPPPEMISLKEKYEARYGSWNPEGARWLAPWYFFFAAIEKANSLEVDDIMAALQSGDMDVSTPMGHAIMVKRPDLGNDRRVDCVGTVYIAKFVGGCYTPKAKVSINEGVAAFEEVYGIEID